MDVVSTIAAGSRAAGHEVAIAYGRRPETPATPGVAGDVEMVELRWGRRRPWQELSAGRALRGLLREWRPDVLHLHSSLAGVLGTTVASGQVTIYSPHSFESALPAGRARRGAIRSAERGIVQRATLVGAVSPSEAAIAEMLGARKVVVVENGIAELDPGRALERPLPERACVMAGGRTVPQRRPEACARILTAVSDVADVRWVGGGDGRSRGGTASLKDAGIAVTGWLPRGESLDLLAEATVYLHWTAWDGQPLSVLEALACDAVVIASDIPPNRHVLGPDQVFSDEEAAIAAIRRAVEDRDHADRLRDCQRRRRGRWGAGVMVREWLEVYEACLGGHRADT